MFLWGVGSNLFVTDVLILCGIKEEVADGGNQTVDTEGDHGQENICQCSGSIALGLEGSVVDYDASDPTEKEGQYEANEIVGIVHDSSS